MATSSPLLRYMPLRLPIFLRRPSSVSLPDSRFGAAGITISTLPFFAGSRSGSPVGKFSRFARYILGQRKASSAQPTIPRYRGIASPASWKRDKSPLPAVHTGLFEPSFFNSNFSSHTTQPYTYYHLFFVFRIDADTTIQSFNEMTFPPHAYLGVGIPLLPLHDLSIDINATDFNPNDPSAWMSAEYNNSQTSSTHTGFPAHSDISLPVVMPRPQHAAAQFDHWKDISQQYNVLARGLDYLQGPSEQQITKSWRLKSRYPCTHHSDGTSSLLLDTRCTVRNEPRSLPST